MINEIKKHFEEGNMVTRLILANAAVFILIRLLELFNYLFSFSFDYVSWFILPSAVLEFLLQPWSIISYNFMHEDFFHIAFNMVVLHVFGNVLYMLLGNRKILPLYIMGGVAGGLFFMLCYNLLPAFSQVSQSTYLLGASAAVMSIIVASATLEPNFEIVISPFQKHIKIKYIALAFIIIDLLTITRNNPGGHLSHLGGAVFGYWFITQLKNGNDLSVPFNNQLDKVASWIKKIRNKNKYTSFGSPENNTSTKPKYNNDTLNIHTKNNQNAKPNSAAQKQRSILQQQKLDAILDKISQKGYASLSTQEKEFLFNESNKVD